MPDLPRRTMRLLLGDVANGIVLTLALVAVVYARSTPLPSFLVFLASWILIFVSVHPLAHRVVGAVCGVRFLHYYVAPSSIANLRVPVISRLASRLPLFGLRVERASLEGLAPLKGWVTYASGAIASILVPTVTVLYAYFLGEILEALLLTLLTIGNGLFTLHYSTKSGDFWRAKRVKSQLESV